MELFRMGLSPFHPDSPEFADLNDQLVGKHMSVKGRFACSPRILQNESSMFSVRTMVSTNPIR